METHLRNFEDNQKKDQGLALVLEMNSPGNKGTVVRGRPCICCKAEAAIVFLEIYSSTKIQQNKIKDRYPKKFLDAVSRALIHGFEITGNRAATRDLELGPPSGKEVIELSILNNFEGPIRLGNPANDACTKER
jgi:hypothetical protein